MDTGYHFLFLLKFSGCFFFGALIGTLLIDIDHFIPQIFKGEKCGYGARREDLWLHSLYWPVTLLGIALGMVLHLVVDHFDTGCTLERLI